MIVSDSRPSRGSSSRRDDEIEHARNQAVEQFRGEVRLAHGERHAWRTGAQLLCKRGHECGGHARHCADAQLAGAAVGERGQIGARRFEVPGDRIGVPEQLAACLGELDRAPSRRARHERHADDPLERLQLLADGRLRIAQADGRAADRSLARDRLERGEMAQIETGPFRKRGDR